MCGIIGYAETSPTTGAHLGATVLQMLIALGRRGPDSAGIAYYAGSDDDRYVARIKLGGAGRYELRASEVLARIAGVSTVVDHERSVECLRVVMCDLADPGGLHAVVEALHPDHEVISLGRSLEIVKQVGSPRALDERFSVSNVAGSHAIAHTRLCTESRIDLSHSQPFWAHGVPDVATVHNGHITNYHKLRRQYEGRGVRFYTENDSEIIGIYLGEMLASGASLRDALEMSLHVFDGSFCYLAATSEEFGFAKDPFGFKPLVVAETDTFVAIATEEIALRSVLDEDVITSEPPPGVVRTWRVGPVLPSAVGQGEVTSITGEERHGGR